ncbi:MAG: APC family permease, partial [Pseudomonadota bacterium]
MLSSTTIVAGSMIGSGIFIVSSDIARQLGSPGWLLVVWVLTGLLTLAAALSYGELAAMFPRAGGQYVYLREAFGPLSAFLYGWALFLVIQTGTIAAVAIAFARFLGVLWPAIGPEHLLLDFGLLEVAGIGFLSLSLSTQQLTAILVIVVLTASNLTGLHTGRWIQDTFTIAKVGALLGLIGLGLLVERHPGAAIASADFWTPVHAGAVVSIPALVPLLATAMVGALFSADAWNNVTFTAGEVKDPERNIPLSMALGVGLVTLLYVLANVVYLSALPIEAIQTAPQDRVGVVAAEAIMGANAELIMAIAIMVSCFGCNNGMILAGARVYFSMARDGLLFRPIGRLNRFRVPGIALLLQALWTIVLTLPRTYDPASG